KEVQVSKTFVKLAVGLVAVVVLGLAGAAIAGAAGAFHSGSRVPSAAKTRATAAALRITGGGRANSVERDPENGATYEVEVTKPDGATVDVRLDGSYKLVVVEGDSESGDGADANDG